MIEVSNKIETYTTTRIINKCPKVGDTFTKKSDINFEQCKVCDFCIDRKCEYFLYETVLVGQHSESEDDDFGGMPVTDYMKVFKCANCGTGIMFTSGMSGLCMNDSAKCPKCGLVHYYMGWSDGSYQFAVSKKKKVEDGLK